MDSRASENVGPGAVLSGAELAVVVPTFNERDNIRPLLDRLEVALTEI